jgi:hypothetical protein
MTDIVFQEAMVNQKKEIVTTNLPQSEVWLEWENYAWDCLVDRMRECKVSYKELSRRLEDLGIYESPDRLNRKVNRKRFSAAFFLVCLEVMKDDVTAVTEGE